MAEFASRQAQAESSYLISPARPERSAHEPVHAPDPLVVQQQALGNQAMQRLANQCPLKLPSPALCPTGGACHACPSPLQAKLTVNEPGDPYEQEADRIAEEAMRQPVPPVGEQPIQRQCQDCDEEVRRQPAALEGEEEEETPVQAKPVAGAVTPLVQRQTEPVEEEEEEPVQAKEAPGAAPQVTPAVQAQMSALRGGGQPLPTPLRSFFEPRLGHDLSGVRLHTGAMAATTAQAVRARAFTLGRDVVFGAGQYAPETESGQKLLAHELVHVVQQGEERPRSSRILRQVPGANPTPPRALPYDVGYGPSRANCAVYQSRLAKNWLSYSYRNNAQCACLNTPNEPHNNCVRKCLQDKMRGELRRLDRLGAVLPVSLPLEADPLCPTMWEHHVQCYRACGCAHGFTNYPTFSVMCRSPFPCSVVGKSIDWFNACVDMAAPPPGGGRASATGAALPWRMQALSEAAVTRPLIADNYEG